MQKAFKLFLIGQFVFASLALIACGPPPYPKCKKDEHCSTRPSPKTDKLTYCVNGMCVQCRAGKGDCTDTCQKCEAGRCQDISGCCKDDSMCKAGEKCRDNKCTPECSAQFPCPAGQKCENNRCVPDHECTVDADCKDPEKPLCKDNKCVAKPVIEVPKPPACTLERVNFDFDQATIRTDAADILKKNAECIKQFKTKSVTIEGHCDERGTREYNLALGERRAKAVKDYLVGLGVSADLLTTLSKGEEDPVQSCSNESCWSKNRRGELKFK